MRRRDLLRRGALAAGATVVGSLAGCLGGDGEAELDREENEVLVGPRDSLAFRPETLTVSAGTTVTWSFESRNHNVACDPGELARTASPEGADPFTSYEDGDTYETEAVGATFEHAFEEPGTYDYVCVPHVTSDMTGTIEVEAGD
ncbi:plastocyanin/azurin family copper-binding protein [Halomicrobium salinisoli]|uniref:plastocyanin/azurin family copper-binding protein n=1 Tax=Halomicrobium salinisoli TaxID=2878391 RepID=UPI001CF00285|nr:plastocyanin/azurin family copper-binding protein [Halomicrobium salinisoli]